MDIPGGRCSRQNEQQVQRSWSRNGFNLLQGWGAWGRECGYSKKPRAVGEQWPRDEWKRRTRGWVIAGVSRDTLVVSWEFTLHLTKLKTSGVSGTEQLRFQTLVSDRSGCQPCSQLCITLERPLNLTKLQFPPLENGAHNSAHTCLTGFL